MTEERRGVGDAGGRKGSQGSRGEEGRSSVILGTKEKEEGLRSEVLSY